VDAYRASNSRVRGALWTALYVQDATLQINEDAYQLEIHALQVDSDPPSADDENEKSVRLDTLWSKVFQLGKYPELTNPKS
jgi:hypothetical protein